MNDRQRHREAPITRARRGDHADANWEGMVAQAYQVIGNLLDHCGLFESEEGQRALDYFSGSEYDEDFLPWMPVPPKSK